MVFVSNSSWSNDKLKNQTRRSIHLQTEKKADAVHWGPAVIEVKQGEKVTFLVDHKLEGGFDFHGFSIQELKIVSQVNRGKTLEVNTDIPADMKPGEYPISCQFHPKHVQAKLIVKPSK